jgi:hypothetical protein
MQTIEYQGRMTQFLKEHFSNKALVGAEIGVLNGDHAERLLQTLNIRRLYLIDPYCAYEDYHDHNRHGLEKVKAKAIKRMASYDLHGDKIRWIFKPSRDAIRFIHMKLDFVYIDGNHGKTYVESDLWGYLSLVGMNGVIGGHDYFTRKDPENLCEVKEAVDEFHRLLASTLYLDGSYEHDWPDWWFVKDVCMIGNLLEGETQDSILRKLEWGDSLYKPVWITPVIDTED